MRTSILLIVILGALPVVAEDATAWLERSIAYHDPGGVWGSKALRLQLSETRPDGPDRGTVLRIEPGESGFYWQSEREGRRLEGELSPGRCEHRLDGSSQISAEDRERFRLDCDRLRWIRDYYVYLWGLPMKLRDPGTRLDPEAVREQIDGRPVVTLRVTYEPEVGGDTWYFYLDPETAALVAYRFYHDEAKGDGEHIALEGEVAAEGLRLPQARSWTTNAEGRLLGTDTLLRLTEP